MGETYTITIDNDGTVYRCADGRSLLEGMEALGRRGIPVGCRGGGCGVCKVEITQGAVSCKVMSREHVSADEEAAGCVLACRSFPRSDIRLRALGGFRKSVRGATRKDEVDSG